jgi:aspartyl-tRNA(Asn)/glutamyl-tRNA(Gln) amidotransferase subunit A
MITGLTLNPPPEATITGAGEALRAGRLSCRQLLERCLARIDELEADVRAWVIVDREGALVQAEALDAELAAGIDRGPLHGIPLGIKDIIDVAGLPTACGSKRWRDRIADRDAPLLVNLRTAGAVFVGKTVTTPYAWIDPPPTRNPWDLDRTPGGSSSGSAAALACGMVLGAIGSQTGGSITRPASFCGVCGLKPTYGTQLVDGILPFAPSLDHPGPLARTVTDLRLLLRGLDGTWDQPTPQPEPRNGPIRLARLRGFFDDQAEPPMRTAFEAALGTFRAAGIAVVDADDPVDFPAILRRHRTVMAAEAAAVHREGIAEHPDDYPPRITALIEEGLRTSALDYIRAEWNWDRDHWPEFDSLFERADILATPAALGPAPTPETTGDPRFNSPWSYLGLPTVTFPIGSSPEGLPLGIQLIGNWYEDGDLLRAAALCESATRTV